MNVHSATGNQIAYLEDALAAANERIRELEAGRDEWKTSTIDANKRFRQAEAFLAAEREVSDKLEKALKVAQLYLDANHHSHNTVSAALAEVAAIRSKGAQP